MIKKSWLNADGSMKSEQEIKISCVNWSPEMWEEYLKNFESSQKEMLLEQANDSESLSEEKFARLYLNLIQQEEYPKLRKVIKAALYSLPKNEQQVLHALYWEELSQREAAKKLSLSRTTLTNYRDRGLKRLADMMISGAIKKGIEFLSGPKIAS